MARACLLGHVFTWQHSLSHPKQKRDRARIICSISFLEKSIQTTLVLMVFLRHQW